MRKIFRFIAKNLEEIVLSLLFVNMCGFVLIQIVSRYVFRSPLLYTEEVSRYSYIWICFFGMAMATKLKNHIRIELVFIFIKGKAQAVINLVLNIISLGLYVVIFFIGLDYTITNAVQLSPAMEISKAFIYVSLPLGALFSVIRMLAILKQEIKEIRTV
jgi:TRAP-type C4-dicarboxylate transport system permease small subunit